MDRLVTIAEQALPEEVSRFCSKRQLLPHLETAIGLVEAHFNPDRSLQFSIEADPETDEEAVVIDVTLAMDVAEVLECKRAYTRLWVASTLPCEREKIRLLYNIV